MKILIIDGNNTMYRAYHAYSRLQNLGKPVSIIYGMPVLVNTLINQFKPDKIFICWDKDRSPIRLRLYPGYKAGRKTKTEEEAKAFYNQRDEVMKIFYSLGLKQLFAPKMEADDFIYMLVRKYQKEKENKITIISTDKDFHQLIRSNVKVYNTASRNLIHKNNLKVKYGYEPKNCVDYLCLIGDGSDNIKGLRGIGPAKAGGIIQEFSSIKKFLKSDKPFAKIDKDQLRSIYKLNRQLIDLKLFYKKHLKGNQKIEFYNGDKTPKFNQESLFRMCKIYNVKGFKESKFLKNYQPKK
jgi:DNA polymerase-1